MENTNSEPITTGVQHTHPSQDPSMEYTREFEWFHTQVNFLVGKLLTVTDATFADKEQREAQKSIIKKEVNDWRDYVYELLSHRPRKGTPDEGIHESAKDSYLGR